MFCAVAYRVENYETFFARTDIAVLQSFIGAKLKPTVYFNCLRGIKRCCALSLIGVLVQSGRSNILKIENLVLRNMETQTPFVVRFSTFS